MFTHVLPVLVVGVAQVLSAPGVDEFPGPGFDPPARAALESHVLTVWPGPSGLLALWQSGVLDSEEQVALLLGGGHFHDPQLLPAYQEGIASRSPRVRAAALHGYRGLLADEAPAADTEVTADLARVTLEEMQEVAGTLRRHTVADLWMAALLASRGASPPGWSGVVLRRAPTVCYDALDQLLWPEDLDRVLVAWELAQDPMLLGPLVPFVEGMALVRFPVRPWQESRRWSRDNYREADQAVREWNDARCLEGRDRPAEDRLESLAPTHGRPLAAGGCEAWLQVLARGAASWWPLALRQLYRCGAPPDFVPMLQGDGPQLREVRTRVLQSYGLTEPSRRR